MDVHNLEKKAPKKVGQHPEKTQKLNIRIDLLKY